jgi:hypothetical protein
LEDRTLAIAVVFTGLCVMGLGMLVLYGGDPPPAPERPKPPPVMETAMTGAVKYSPTIYRALLEQDARAFGIPPVSATQISTPNPYFEEWKGHRRLKSGASMDTPHLRLTVLIEKQQGGSSQGQIFKVDHLVLRIENLTPSYLAYRVETDVTSRQKCAGKGEIPHNAIAIEPGEVIQRTECLYWTDQSVDITHIEVIEMPALSAYYVSRLPPALILYDPRTSAGHQPPRGKLCAQTFSWREIREGADRGDLGWRDVIDYYARHNCDEYTFFSSYHYRVRADEPLPARAQGG